MGLSCILEYHNQKGGFVANRSMHNFFDLLYTLVLFFCQPRMGCKNIPHRGLELGCDDDAYYNLVLDKLKVD